MLWVLLHPMLTMHRLTRCEHEQVARLEHAVSEIRRHLTPERRQALSDAGAAADRLLKAMQEENVVVLNRPKVQDLLAAVSNIGQAIPEIDPQYIYPGLTDKEWEAWEARSQEVTASVSEIRSLRT